MLKGEAELKILLELTRRQLRSGRAVRISSRELAQTCNLARGKLQAALDRLAKRGFITTRQGTATTPATHHVAILDTVRIGGSKKEPPPAQGWLQLGATPH
jgi:DNA-binding transcriptional MocR family regulator